MEANEEGPGTSLAQRMIYTFLGPGTTFAAVRERTAWRDWFAPTLIVLLASPLPILLRVPSASLFVEMLPDFYLWPRLYLHGFLELFITAGALLLVANSILGGRATYGQMLAVSAYASLVSVAWPIVYWILGTESWLPGIGLGLLLSDEMRGTFAGRMLARVELFECWRVLLLAIGTDVMAGCSTRRALVPVLILWAVWPVVQAGLYRLLP